jgi:HlyD family secretion protein
VVSVSGRVVPMRWAALGTPRGGRLASILVQEGQRVQPGQELAAFEHADVDLAVRAANESLLAQKAELARAQATPVAVDEQAAKAQLQAAKAALNMLQSYPQARDLEEARLQVEYARNMLYATQLEGNIPGIPVSAQQAARAKAAAAEQSLRIAEVQYERVKAGAPQDNLATAHSAVAQFQAALDRLQRGASTEELDALRAAVGAAQVTLEQAQLQVAESRLAAPFAGTVVQISARAGEWTAPGAPVLILGDLTSLRIETTDLDQTDLGRVQVGQAADLTFDALPDAVLRGTVARIADMSPPGQGGASFTLFVNLDQPDPRLRWGMTAFVDIRLE